MEPVSFSLGVVGLVGAFTACVDCFEYFHIGRNLGSDFETSIIKLDIVRLRFTRWGESVGIGQGDENVAIAQLKNRQAVPDKDFSTVERILGQILRLFENAAETSNRLALKVSKKVPPVSNDIGLENVTIRTLHENMRNLALRRQKQSTALQKVSWALHRKRDFEGLIEDLTELVTALTELVPAKPQEELCSRELAELGTDQNLVVLDNVLREPVGEGEADIDTVLHKCVVETIDQRKGAMTTATWKKSKAGDGSRIHQGDFVANDYRGQVFDREGNYLVDESEFGKNVVFHQGHCYGASQRVE